MSAVAMVRNVGMVGLLQVDGLQVQVLIEDVRTVFDRKDYLVSPIAGCGRQWVSAHRVSELRLPVGPLNKLHSDVTA